MGEAEGEEGGGGRGIFQTRTGGETTSGLQGEGGLPAASSAVLELPPSAAVVVAAAETRRPPPANSGVDKCRLDLPQPQLRRCSPQPATPSGAGSGGQTVDTGGARRCLPLWPAATSRWVVAAEGAPDVSSASAVSFERGEGAERDPQGGSRSQERCKEAGGTGLAGRRLGRGLGGDSDGLVAAAEPVRTV